MLQELEQLLHQTLYEWISAANRRARDETYCPPIVAMISDGTL